MKSLNGKLPPQAIDLEEIVLGSMLISKYAFEEVMDFLKPQVFYNSENKLIYEAIQSLYHKSEPIDLKTVSTELVKTKKLEKVGGDYYLIQLTQKISSSAHIEFHSRILLQKYIQRELIRNSTSIIENAYDDGTDALNLLDKAYNHLSEVSDLIIRNKEVDIKSLTLDILEHAGKLYRKEIKPGLETPIKLLTSRMGGWRDEELIILAARPGMGKTAFALKCAWLNALQNIPVAFFSLEMSSQQLLTRLWSMECKIDNDKFSKDGLSPEEERMVLSRMNQFEKIPFFIDDTPNLTIQTLLVKAKKLKKKQDIKMLLVDYLQLMSGNSKNREQEISKISRGLKMIAKELKIPVIALSQLSRAVETRGGSKRPLLSDLRESGAIEQDADVVQFIWRPEYYNQENWDDYNGESCAGQAEYIIAKNRNGGLVRNRMKFEGKYTRFSDIDEDEHFFDSNDQEYTPPPPKPNNNVSEAFGNDEEDDLPF